MLVSFFVSPGVGLFVDNVFREDKCKSLAIAVTGITVFVLIICLASLVKGLSFATSLLDMNRDLELIVILVIAFKLKHFPKGRQCVFG